MWTFVGVADGWEVNQTIVQHRSPGRNRIKYNCKCSRLIIRWIIGTIRSSYKWVRQNEVNQKDFNCGSGLWKWTAAQHWEDRLFGLALLPMSSTGSKISLTSEMITGQFFLSCPVLCGQVSSTQRATGQDQFLFLSCPEMRGRTAQDRTRTGQKTRFEWLIE